MQAVILDHSKHPPSTSQQNKPKESTIITTKSAPMWTPQDDILLTDAMQNGDSFEKVSKRAKLSSKKTKEDIETRWKELLFQLETSEPAVKEMVQLPFSSKRVLWSEFEEIILRREVQGDNFVSFQRVLEENRAHFHPSRTAKSLEAHYYRMKRQGSLKKSKSASGDTNTTITHEAVPSTIIKREDQIPESKKRRAVVFRKRSRKYKYSSTSPKQYNLGIIRGKRLRVEMTSQQLLIGRNTSTTIVDVDINIEGPAPKVSKKQALIELKSNGTFAITNIGKSSMFVNGKRINSGETGNLKEDSIIKIKQYQFVFIPNIDWFPQ